jgi:hypothetical protein
MARRFLKTWWAGTSMSASGIVPVRGSMGITPEVNSRESVAMAWEYGPTAAGALSVWTDLLVIVGLLASNVF